ncbi:MAG TPA: toll/interleukin-1 receptor domain-containing protein, partial [Caulobacteraceae bacterium]
MDADQHYWAFISYSHDDGVWAKWLHRALESYRVPRHLVGRDTGRGPAPARLRPIFRDRDDMAADPDLKERLRTILAQSANLIVVCSPQAATSAWVEDEILTFKRLHGERGVLPVIVDGEPNAGDTPGRAAEECFPNALRFHLEADGTLGTRLAEPVAADLRPGGDGRRSAVLKVLAGMLGCDLDELVRRDTARRHRRMVALTAASLVVSLVMTGLTFTAIRARSEAQAERDRAEGLIEFMLVDLRKKLEPAGRLDILDAVGARSMDYYASQSSSRLEASALGRRARVLQLLGSLRDTRGDLNAALTMFEAAAKSTGELLERDPDNPARIFDHAQSVYWVGYMAQRQGRLAQAQARFEDYRRLAQRLVAIDPRREDWRAELAYADTDLGVVMLKQHRTAPAAEAFAGALPILRARALA